MGDKPMNIRIDEAWVEPLNTLANELQMDQSHLVRQAIWQFAQAMRVDLPLGGLLIGMPAGKDAPTLSATTLRAQLDELTAQIAALEAQYQTVRPTSPDGKRLASHIRKLGRLRALRERQIEHLAG